MKKFLPLLVVLLGIGLLAQLHAQQTVFDKVKVRYNRSGDDVRLVDKNVDLILDDGAKKLIVRGSDRPIEINYADVTKVVLETTRHMRGGALSQMVGGLAGAAIASKKVQDYWCYIEYKQADGSVQPYLMEVAKEVSDQVVEKMRATFGERVILAEFPEAEEVDKNTLAALQTKHDVDVDKKSRPMPQLKPDKALVVAVCPPLAARYAGKGNQFKLHANDRVIAVNKMGTYSFAYLEPGEYLLVSQTENASGIRLKLEAGKDYYFLQNTFMGTWKAKTSLSQHTAELVKYELNGAWYSDWREKKD
jgi:hypothetical protein